MSDVVKKALIHCKDISIYIRKQLLLKAQLLVNWLEEQIKESLSICKKHQNDRIICINASILSCPVN